MRIRIIRQPATPSIDGVRLDLFIPGQQYEVGTAIAALLLAEGWAEPVSDDGPSPVVPFSETDPFQPAPYRDPTAPPNLHREHYPPYLAERPDLALDFERRRRQRHKTLTRQR